jgi:predicted nucleic acid-binding protein
MRILLDTNVVLDVMLEREPWRGEAEAIANADADGFRKSHLCASAITDIYYISRKLVGSERARVIVRTCLDRLQLVSVTRDLLEAAQRRGGNDFEDDLQIACAVQAGLDAIVTPNPKDFPGSPIPVLTPKELLAVLA